MDILLIDTISDRVLFFIEKFSSHQVDIADSLEVAIDYLTSKTYRYIFIGGELGKTGSSGADVARFLSENPDNPNNDAYIVAHSWNMFEVEEVIQFLPHTRFVPFDEITYGSLEL